MDESEDMARKYQIKDCSERLGFNTPAQAIEYLREWSNPDKRPTAFKCPRCTRWHLAPGYESIERIKKVLHPIRCVTDRDLHLSMARASGISLEELERRVDLSKVHIKGPGVEIVKARNVA